MKYLILFLVSFNLHALTLEERMDDISDLRYAMFKCAFPEVNVKLFIKDVIANQLSAKVDCLELKDVEVKQEKQDRKDKKDQDVLSVNTFKDLLPDLKTGTKLTSKQQDDLFILLIEKL